ncbi:LysM domain-containing protein [Pallidibacillus thermolactis subsp. kokeshiiformis]|uniref:LysM peptidoglycan-binding domain-containing protein n=1 Tax=Pallidibacillus thermolactis TaxID=251051 RepID=UPI0035EF2E70
MVKPRDNMCKIATRHQVRLKEIIRVNPHIQNPFFIYPNNKFDTRHFRKEL